MTDMVAKEMAKRLHDKGWTFDFYCDMIETGNVVGVAGMIDAVGDELAELDKEGKE